MLDLDLSLESLASLTGGTALTPADPFANYAFALDFVNGEYWVDGADAGPLSSLSGYAFADNVDNVPNIDGSGYHATTAEASELVLTINPVTTDQDFIFWAVGTFDGAASDFNMFANLASADLYIGRTDSGFLTANGLTFGDAVGGSSRCAVLFRRRAGANTIAILRAGVVTVDAEGAAAFSNPTSTIFIGCFDASPLYVADAAIEFVGMRLGTFDDAAVTAILEAA